ncbi:MAG: ABC transporter substrate binding protein [Romboutsia sp.]|uniref:ABC transporter substrate binding protein n=1 Tax=Romboutsia sp. TaxID=1965302 RepID=UPI003F3B350F
MKKSKVLAITLLFLVISFKIEIFATETKEKVKDEILIINSYDSKNTWEKSVLEGFYNEIKIYEEHTVNINLEYLDSKKRNDKEYIDKFKSLIETKYTNIDIDLIIAVDDEAFDLAREVIFNGKSIFYKDPLIFIGVNQEIYLTNEEKKYITGFIDVKDKLQIIDLITKLQPKVKTINILLDNTFYNRKIKSDISNSSYLLERYVKINFTQSEYEDILMNEVKKMNPDEEAIIISGVFKNKKSKVDIDPKEFVENIKTISKIPTYTDREDYAISGVIGGYVDIGRDNGVSCAKMALRVLRGETVENILLSNEPNGKYIFDYNEVYKYKIDILNIPKGSIILNKSKYQLLIPKYHKIIIGVILSVLIILIAGIIYIIHREKRHSSKNKKLYALAKEREELKTDFIVNMSHELRTPLNVIISISKLLEMKVDKGEVEKDYLLEKINKINQNSSRLRRLINNLIDISKFEAGFYEYKCDVVNIVYLIEEIVMECVDFANQKEIELIFDTEEEEIITSVDIEKIERAILNLLSNAIKFTQENGKIEVLVKRIEKNVMISVKDNGMGIAKDKLDQIFYRFYQIDSSLSRSNEGSGIGLCLVEEIVKMHDGSIKVYSEENKGSNFEITLPIKHTDEIIEDKSIKNIAFKDVVKLEMSDIDK